MRLAAFQTLALAALTLAGTWGCAAPTAALKGERNASFDGVFAPQTRGFLGADGAASVDLGKGRSLWVFGDTILGNLRAGKREGTMVRNSIAIVTTTDGKPGSSKHYWDLTDNLPGDFFHPPSFSDPEWYWPGTGFTHDGKVYLLLSRMAKGEGPDAFAFRTVGCTLFRIDNPGDAPTSWKMTQTTLGLGNDHFNINSASFVEGDFVYLMGYDDGPNKVGMERRTFLSRLSLGALDTADPGKKIEYWSTGAKWSAEATALEPLFRPGPTETAIMHDAPRSRYLALTIDPFKTDVLMTSAPKLTGPWSAPKAVYTIPELVGSETDHAYTTRLHPMLSTEDHAVFTYVVNTKDFWGMFSNLDIYYPRFVTLPLESAK